MAEDVWVPLPEGARYERDEDRWLVDDVPVIVNEAATMYVREPDEDEGLSEALESASEALGALTCPWYRRVGICQSGCHDEPVCQTNEPSEGWAEQLARAASELSDPSGTVSA